MNYNTENDLIKFLKKIDRKKNLLLQEKNLIIILVLISFLKNILIKIQTFSLKEKIYLH